MNICFFDIETTGFSRKTDKIIVISCVSNKSDSVTSFYGDEKSILIRFARHINAFDVISTWNGASFDIDFVKKRCKMYGISFSYRKHIDLMKEASILYPNVRFTLDNFSKILGIEARKSDFSLEKWNDARSGNQAAVKYVVEHCEKDVIVLKQLWAKIMG